MCFRLDQDAFISLYATIGVILAVVILIIVTKRSKVLGDIRQTLKKTDSLKIFPIVILLGVAGIALWITIRHIGLFVIRRYIEQVNYNYRPEDIFDMVAFLLTANLCFTLIRALAIEETKDQSQVQSEDDASKRTIRGLIDVAIQAILIGFITFIPRSRTAYESTRTTINYVLIVIIMAVSIIVLVLARQRLTSSKTKAQTEVPYLI